MTDTDRSTTVASDPAASADPAAHLAALAAEAWESEMAAQPIYATVTGDRRFDDRLPANGPGAVDAEADRLGALLGRAEAIDAGTLSPADRVTRDALVDFLRFERELVVAGVEPWSVDPLEGPQVLFLSIPSFQPIADRTQADMLLGRWREMGPWIDRHIASSREALASGVGAPAALVRSVVAELDDLLARPVDELPLQDPAHQLPADWPEADRAQFAADLGAAIADEVRPAFVRYRAFLVDELAPHARGDDRPGLGAVPGGDAAYAHLVRSHTTLDLTPDEIHRTGLAETDRIDAEFAELGARLLGTADRAAILARLRGDPELHFATPAEVFDVAERSLARANAAIGSWFGRLPATPCVVVAMPDHEARHSTIAYYRQPAPDGSRPGSYYINTTEPATRPRYEAEVLAFHEAVPGHHLQIAIAQELAGLPAFRRLAGPTAYVEGWGLYSERLSEEMGLLSGDLDRFGILSFDAWRACRLVVDTGLHTMGWSRDRAIAFMVEHTALAENNIANEVDRYLAMPGQALAYKLGQLEILRLRDEARQALGSAFDIRAFHDVVLGQGAVGLSTLGGVVRAWIAGAGTGMTRRES
jgi:uncharacterized protein (DUF885 family)